MRTPTVCILFAATLVGAAFPSFAARRVALITEGELTGPAAHGIGKLREALRKKGLEVTDAANMADLVVLAGMRAKAPEVETALRSAHAALPEGPEGLAIHRGAYQGKPAVILCGADARGLMYAALDTADRVTYSNNADNPFQLVRDVSEKPFLAERGISIYTMQRAYFESRLYDETYWQRYFDMLASSRINSFVVIFGYENGGFMAPAYPYFFNVAQFPDVELVGITREQQARNTAAFKTMMRLAHERGIQVTAGIWDHIYRGGVQGGGIPGASENAGKRVPGLVWGVTTENLEAYTKVALARFLEVFPELDGIQFRMHSESGLKPAEMAGFWHEVFQMMKQARPNLRVDLRVKDLPDAVIEDALHVGLNARVNTKYWMEQMGLPFHPTHVPRENQRDRRHGYADLLRYPQQYRVHWQLWSGGTTRLLLWGDPEYVRRFAESARLYDGNSFEVNEMLATKMLGELHDAKPLEILNPRYRYYDYEFERYWHFYQLWGRLSYNPATLPEVWTREFERRFGPKAGVEVMEALHLASQVLPRIVAAGYRYEYFPTTRGWAEMNHQDDLAKFAAEVGSDIQQFENPRDEAKSILAGMDTAMRRPQETSRWFAQVSAGILDRVERAQAAAGSPTGKEFLSTVTDLRILAGLARYYAARLPAAVSYSLYKESADLRCFDEAIAKEKEAVQAWSEIVAAAGDVYSTELAFGAHNVGFRRHWKEEFALVQADLEKLLAERRTAPQRADAKPAPSAERDAKAKPPVADLQPVTAATAAKDFEVSARITAPAGVKWVRLRYRHLSQYEDYQTAEMKLDPATRLYRARIPGAFIDPKWDLMYFVEVVDNAGAGRMYPDLEREAPYVVVPVKR
jgi:hypothetical protein